MTLTPYRNTDKNIDCTRGIHETKINGLLMMMSECEKLWLATPTEYVFKPKRNETTLRLFSPYYGYPRL